MSIQPATASIIEKLVLSIVFCMAIAGCSSDESAISASIMEPKPGEPVLSENDAVHFMIGAGNTDYPLDAVSEATLEFQTSDDQTWQSAEVDFTSAGHSFTAPNAIKLTAYGLPSGIVRVRTTLMEATNILYQSTPQDILIQKAPVGRGRITGANPSGTGVRVDFDGSDSKDGNGRQAGIKTWEWDFGDGTPKVTGKTPSHTYTRRGVYMVTLCVTDTKGITTYEYYKVDTGDDPRDTPPPTAFGEEMDIWPDCRCKKMTIRHAAGGAFKGYGQSNGLTGMVNQFGLAGVGQPQVYFGFEVISTIEGNPDKCYEWQAIQRTSRVNNITSRFRGKSVTTEAERNTLRDGGTPTRAGTFPFRNHNPGSVGPAAGSTVSIGGPYGLDGYTAVDAVKQHLPGEIRWKDRPGMVAGFPNSSPANTKRVHLPFSGPPGYCTERNDDDGQTRQGSWHRRKPLRLVTRSGSSNKR